MSTGGLRGYKSFDKAPHPGELKHRISIGYTVSSVNSDGFPVATDTTLCTVWASAANAGLQNYRGADTKNVESTINFTIRYRDGITIGMWVLFQGNKYIISDVGMYSFKKAWLGLKASLTKGVSG